MSPSDALLVFLGRDAAAEGWVRLSGGAVVERGEGLQELPAVFDGETGDPLPVAAVVPGEDVALHWVELPTGLAPAQAMAAARLMGADLSAQPMNDMHVAVGPEVDGQPLRCVALTSGTLMAEWLDRCRGAGADPVTVVPEPLLLLPKNGTVLRHDSGGRSIFRGATEGFVAEPELAGMILRDTPVEEIGTGELEAGLGSALAVLPVNLRQGAFAKRRQWKIDWKQVRRMVLLGAAILLATLTIQFASIMRYTFAADEAEAELTQLAATALPRGVRVTNPARQLTQRLADLQGSGVSYSAMATALFGAVQATPNVELTALNFDRQGTLRATVVGDTPATVAALQQRLESGGALVASGPLRASNGRQTTELTMRAK